jgi:predicted nucleic acid-binding protein
LIVLDASAAIDWLLHTPAGIEIDQRICSRSGSVHVPHVLDLEVAQVLRRFVREGSLSAGRAEAALQDLTDVRFTRYPHRWLIPRIWQLHHPNLTAYDGAYIALAELLDAPLITRDRRMSSSPGHHARIELL